MPEYMPANCPVCDRAVSLRLSARDGVGRFGPHKTKAHNGEPCPGAGKTLEEAQSIAAALSALPSVGATMAEAVEAMANGDLPKRAVSELASWWHQLTDKDLAALGDPTLPTSYDLEMVGHATGESLGRPRQLKPAEAAEIGAWWYLLGIIGKAVSAVREGRMPSREVVDEIRRYAVAIARIRDAGGWPGVKSGWLYMGRTSDLSIEETTK